jgi:hypothetical protein
MEYPKMHHYKGDDHTTNNEFEELKIGDFVIVREAQRDLVKDIADIILANNGKSELRSLAMKWKDALEIESIFSSTEDIFNKLKKIGCTKDFPTISSWITDEDRISPRDKDDLVAIAKVTEDEVLLEKIDEIYEAGKEVRRAHVMAGRYLSDELKKNIAHELQSYGKIDPYNIWEPVSIQLEDIGIVKILKIIDIGSEIVVDAGDANRLIEEE